MRSASERGAYPRPPGPALRESRNNRLIVFKSARTSSPWSNTDLTTKNSSRGLNPRLCACANFSISGEVDLRLIEDMFEADNNSSRRFVELEEIKLRSGSPVTTSSRAQGFGLWA